MKLFYLNLIFLALTSSTGNHSARNDSSSGFVLHSPPWKIFLENWDFSISSLIFKFEFYFILLLSVIILYHFVNTGRMQYNYVELILQRGEKPGNIS